MDDKGHLRGFPSALEVYSHDIRENDCTPLMGRGANSWPTMCRK